MGTLKMDLDIWINKFVENYAKRFLELEIGYRNHCYCNYLLWGNGYFLKFTGLLLELYFEAVLRFRGSEVPIFRTKTLGEL